MKMLLSGLSMVALGGMWANWEHFQAVGFWLVITIVFAIAAVKANNRTLRVGHKLFTLPGLGFGAFAFYLLAGAISNDVAPTPDEAMTFCFLLGVSLCFFAFAKSGKYSGRGGPPGGGLVPVPVRVWWIFPKR